MEDTSGDAQAESSSTAEASFVNELPDQFNLHDKDEKFCQEYVQEVKVEYDTYVESFVKSANRCAQAFQRFQQDHTSWRRLVICITGSVAILNAVAAFTAGSGSGQNGGWPYNSILAILTAVVAGGAAIVSNLESFSKNLERAQGYRSAREIFLNAYGEAKSLWIVHVRPVCGTPEGCKHSANLLKWVQKRDADVRDQVKQLTDVEQN